MFKSTRVVIPVILIGDCRVGKTSFLKRLVQEDKPFARDTPPTIGVEYATKNIRIPNINKEIKAQIWDTCRFNPTQRGRRSTSPSHPPITGNPKEPFSSSTSPPGNPSTTS